MPSLSAGSNALFSAKDEVEAYDALAARYNEDEIYTSIGPVLLAVNPYAPVAACDQRCLAELAALNAGARTALALPCSIAQHLSAQ